MWIVIVSERKRVMALQPTTVGISPFLAAAMGQHEAPLIHQYVRSLKYRAALANKKVRSLYRPRILVRPTLSSTHHAIPGFLHRPLCPLAHRTFACRLPGGGAGELSGCTGTRWSLVAAY